VREVGVRRLSVDALAVAERFRRQGVGRMLMEAAERWGRRRGAELVVLDTWIDSPLSVPFYDALGYRRRQIKFDKPLGAGVTAAPDPPTAKRGPAPG
jgi:ribosomal protein S18 acetylase RimI-like enzyme